MKCLVILPSPESPALRTGKIPDADSVYCLRKRCRRILRLAGELKKSCGAGIDVISCGHDFSGGMIPYALASEAREGVYLLLSGKQAESLSAEGVIAAMLAGKMGHYDILLSAYDENFSRALAEYLGIGFVCHGKFEICGGSVFLADEPEKKAVVPPVMICFKETASDEVCYDSIYNSGWEMNFADIKKADSRPFYIWKEEDTGTDITAYLEKNIPEFEKILSACFNEGGKTAEGRKTDIPAAGCTLAAVSPAEAAAGIAGLLSACSSKVVVGGGRGLNTVGAGHLRYIAEAGGFGIAATRPAVQAGLLPESCLAGPHRRIPRADIYVAFGISGAPLHMAGINAHSIVAVNNDLSAPVFSTAVKGFICDANAVLEILASLPAFRTGGSPGNLRKSSSESCSEVHDK